MSALLAKPWNAQRQLLPLSRNGASVVQLDPVTKFTPLAFNACAAVETNAGLLRCIVRVHCNVRFGSWLCKNVTARDSDRMNVLLNCNYCGRNS